MHRIAQFLVARPRLATTAFLALAIASIFALPHVTFSFSITPLVEGEQSSMKRILDLERELPTTSVDYICSLSWSDPIRREQLEFLAELSAELEDHETIRKVRSLGTTPLLTEGSPLPVLFPTVVGDGTALAVAEQHPLIYRRLLAADGRSALMLITSTNARADFDSKSKLLDWLEETLPARAGPDVDVAFVSGFVAEKARRGYMRDDLFVVLGLELLVFMLVLPAIFRSFRGVLLPLLAAALSVVFGFGLLAATDGELGIIELAIPGLVIMIAVSDAVHLLHRYEEERENGQERNAAILAMCAKVGMACLITSVTTAIGFASLVFADHDSVREFGLTAACGVMVTFFVTVLVMTLGLMLFPARAPAPPRLPGLARLGYGKPKLVVAGFAILLAFSAAGMSRIEMNSRWLEELPASDPINEHLALLENQFTGVMTLSAEVRGDLTKLENVRALEAVQDRLAASEGVLGAQSVGTWLRAASGNPAEFTQSHVDRGSLALRLLGGSFPTHVTAPDYQRSRLILNLANIPSQQYLALRDQISVVARDLAPNLEIEAIDYVLMAHESSLLVAGTLLKSLGISLLVITILITLIYRSLKIGLIAIVPNMIPIAFALGLTGWLGMNLRVGIVMIYSVGLGLAVDDCIHLLTRYVQTRRENPSMTVRAAMHHALRTSGVALLVTTAILLLGTLCFLPANFQSMQDLGVLLSAIVVVALIADLFVLPAMIERFCREDGVRRH